MKVSYNWLQTFFAEGTLPPVEDIEQKLIFHAYEIEGVEKVGDDSVLDVDVLPNRASDSLSHRGIAREIATLFALQMKEDPLHEPAVLEPLSDKIMLTIDDDHLCPVHTLALIEGVTVKESPQWLKERLEAIGQKSINNVVDATNYIMYGLGQPSHVFDFDKLEQKSGVKGIRVRTAKDGEELSLLGGAEVVLTPETYVLADAQSDTALDVAGVKGGMHAELDMNTKNVLVTAAKFDPTITRKTAQRLKIRTDASSRYENEVPDQLPQVGMHAVVQLILKIAGGALDGYQVAGDANYKNPEVVLSTGALAKHIGIEIPVSEIAAILERLGFTFTQDSESFAVTAPYERLDITIPEDLMEEVARVYGYNNIPPVALASVEAEPPILKTYALAQKLRKILVKDGFREVMLYSLRDSGEVKLKNSLNAEKDHMRANLKDGVAEALEQNERNMPLLGEYGAVKIFEYGNIFTLDSEDTHMCIGVRAIGGKKKESRTDAEIATVKEAIESELQITLPAASEGIIEFDLADFTDKVTLDTYERVGSVEVGMQYAPMSPYPFMIRDIALWVPENTDEAEIHTVITEHGGALLQRIDRFDEFTKDGRVSLAFHIIFQSMDETLTDEGLAVIMQKIEANLGSKEGFEVR